MWYAEDVGCVKGISDYQNDAAKDRFSFALASYKAEKSEMYPYFPLIEGNF